MGNISITLCQGETTFHNDAWPTPGIKIDTSDQLLIDGVYGGLTGCPPTAEMEVFGEAIVTCLRYTFSQQWIRANDCATVFLIDCHVLKTECDARSFVVHI